MKCCKCCSPTCSVVSIITSIIICCIAALLKMIMPGILEDAILGGFVLSEDSPIYEFWKSPPIVMHANFYVFNYTNGQDFFPTWSRQAKPKVQQLGPYVFSVTMHRKNITFFDNKEVEYKVVPKFEFAPELSNGSVDDVIIMPNIVLRTAVQHPMAKSLAGMFLKETLIQMGYTFNPFVNHTIGELLVDGFFEPIVKYVQSIGVGDLGPAMKDGRVCLKDFLFQSNMIRIKTGSTGYKDFGQVVSFKNETSLAGWPKGSKCNEVRGSEIGVFPPKLSIDERLYLFIGELCRAIFFRFEKKVEHFGIKANRFILDPDVMSNTNHEYECFCMSKENKCWGTGVFNIGPCNSDAPILLSLPHLLNTEYRFKNAIAGLEPDPEKHQFFMDLETMTSFPLKITAGLQVNLALEPTSIIREANNVPSIILPIMFLSNFMELNETISALFKAMIVDLPLVITDTIPMVFWGLGNVIGLLGIMCTVFLMFKGKKSSVQPVTEKTLVKKFKH